MFLSSTLICHSHVSSPLWIPGNPVASYCQHQQYCTVLAASSCFSFTSVYMVCFFFFCFLFFVFIFDWQIEFLCGIFFIVSSMCKWFIKRQYVGFQFFSVWRFMRYKSWTQNAVLFFALSTELPDQTWQDCFRDLVLTVFRRGNCYILLDWKKKCSCLVSFDYFNKWLLLPSLATTVSVT